MFTLGPSEILVGLGSSSRDALERLRAARSALRGAPDFELVRSSAIYASDALLPEGAPAEWNLPYLNAVCLLRLRRPTHPMTPPQIVEALKALETQLGRTPAPRWAPRVIDLDLLDIGAEPFAGPTCVVPHPGLSERPFALLPAQDCANLADRSLEARANTWRYAAETDVPFRTRRAGLSWTELVAILNLTPDSFSDGDPEMSASRLERRLALLRELGCRIIDIGAESTRPGATPLSAIEERRRLQVLREVSLEGFTLSLDSYHPETVEWALEFLPVQWINDVAGFESPRMRELARASNAACVVMHSLTVPPVPDRHLPVDEDPVEHLLQWADGRKRALGLPMERLILDPGIGFGKTLHQNHALLRRASELHASGTAWLFGHSRKRFLGGPPEATGRDLETALATSDLAQAGVDYVRIHDPETQMRALRWTATAS